MTTFYLDTSAPVKRYINEPGSSWVRELCASVDDHNEPLHVLFVGRIAIIEFAAALAILERRKIILKGVALNAYCKFTDDWANEYQITEITPNVITRAAILVRRYPLKAYDALHLALALGLQDYLASFQVDLILVTGDTQLLQAAQSEGLAVENPFTYAHPDDSPAQ